MRSGLSFPSYAAQPTWTLNAGTADASFPLANLNDLYNIRQIFKTTGTSCQLKFVLPAAKRIGFFGLVHHNGDSSDTVRVELWSDTNPDPIGNVANRVYDSGVISLFPGASDRRTLYPQTFPLLIPGSPPPVSFSGLVNLSTNAAGTWQIGGIELSGWYQMDGVSIPRQFGLKVNDAVNAQPFGAQHVTKNFNPRMISFTRDMTDQTENATTAADFQIEKRTDNPFVWVNDIDDTATYQREVILVRNAKLTPPKMNAYPAGALAFDLIEHLR